MRSGVINMASPKEDVWGILTGVWGTFRRGVNNEWLVTKCPFFVHMEATLQAGRQELPLAPNSTKALYWTSKDNSGSLIIRAGETGFDLPEPAFVEATFYGDNDNG
ncbi:hypothetical protein [Fibrobacter sp. UWP2]|uniref:hypothetical protein n=1 Tax=Fibrobacter sp. UWP2 TaxID=1896216 RepID=UPI0009129897|nr:hypothetical protein [Fibrobacter sp. UWP2]SHI35595.1 hypothetical protein SAMN05720471_101264 [Fibrobacter sp. UWP2]